MNKRIILFLILGTLFLSLNAWCADKRPISIDTVLQLAEVNSPGLSASRFHELAASKAIDIARANYFPTINAEAIDSTGFSGSSGLLGVGGLMGSPYRSGLSGGLVAQQTIWDFGRTYYDVEANKREAELSQQNTRVTLYQVKQLALEIYYECSFFRSQRDIWAELTHHSAMITKEAQHFVDTGQVSIVDRYLSKAQTEEAQTAEAFFAERLKKSEQQLAVIMGTSVNFSCPPLPTELTHTLNPNIGIETSPILARAIVGKKVALARLQQEKAGYYPKIIAIASVGGMQDASLEKKKEYSAGIGVILPLVDMHTSGEIQRAKAELSARDQEIEAQKQYLEEMNAKYDTVIYASKIRLQHLDSESTLANKAFKTSKERYFSMEGELVDLREAFRNLVRVETAIQETRMQLLQASGSKALLNGAGG